MEFRHLRYFLVAAEEENFNRAAERLYVSQPALSRRIRDLEQEMGVELFHRQNKRVTLSACGQAFYKDVKRTIEDLESAKQHVQSLARGELGTLTLGLNDPAIRHRIVTKALQEFSSRYPNVNLKLSTVVPTSLVDAVLEGNVDAVFLYSRPFDTPSLEYIELGREHYVIALPKNHRLALNKKKIRLADLRSENFIWFHREVAPSIHDRLISACQAKGLTLNIVQHVSSEAIRLQLVAAGMGITFVTSITHSDSVPDNVVIRQVTDLSVPLEFDVAWRRNDVSPVLAHFISVITELTKRRKRP